MNTVEAIPGTRVELAERLQTLSNLLFQVRIDGVPGLLDVRDGIEIPDYGAQATFVLRLTYTADMAPEQRLVAFPTISFHRWDVYDRVTQELHYDACGDTVLAAFNPRTHEPNRDLTRRRLFVQEVLRHAYGSRVDCEMTDQETYWRRATRALVAVHAPGAFNRRLDRSQHQLFGLGCCTITPVIEPF